MNQKQNSGATVHELLPDAADLPLVPMRDRIKRRLEVLQDWHSNGVPEGRVNSIPTSLRQAKDWRDDELGILPIGSPNAFTTKHPSWGREVAAIGHLLTQLRLKYSRPRRSARRPPSFSDPADRRLLDDQLKEVMGQWHSARAEAVDQKTRADSREHRVTQLESELAQKDDEIATLKRRLKEVGTKLRVLD